MTTRCVIYLRVSTKEQAEHGLGEEGFSIPAQREACVRHVADKAWTVVDEYSDRGESARTADRPQLQAMLARVGEDADVDAIVAHKVDRLARNLEDHVAIRAVLRKRGVALVSVTENLEETASGRLVEGIHALMAEFYSANLASEIRKGMGQKAKMGGWPHAAPLGYRNVRESIAGRAVAHIVVDEERAPFITAAFELYATRGVDHQGPGHRAGPPGASQPGRRDRPVGPVGCRDWPTSWPTRPTPASSAGTAWSTPASTGPSPIRPPSSGCRTCSPPGPCAAPANASTTTT